MRSAPMLMAAQMESGPVDSPAWAVRWRPASRAAAKLSRKCSAGPRASSPPMPMPATDGWVRWRSAAFLKTRAASSGPKWRTASMSQRTEVPKSASARMRPRSMAAKTSSTSRRAKR